MSGRRGEKKILTDTNTRANPNEHFLRLFPFRSTPGCWLNRIGSTRMKLSFIKLNFSPLSPPPPLSPPWQHLTDSRRTRTIWLRPMRNLFCLMCRVRKADGGGCWGKGTSCFRNICWICRKWRRWKVAFQGQSYISGTRPYFLSVYRISSTLCITVIVRNRIDDANSNLDGAVRWCTWERHESIFSFLAMGK